MLQCVNPTDTTDILLVRVAKRLVATGDHKFALPILRSLFRTSRRRAVKPILVSAELLLALGAMIHQAGHLRRAQTVWRAGLRRYQSEVTGLSRQHRRAETNALRIRFRLGLGSVLGDRGSPRVAYSLCRRADLILEHSQEADVELRTAPRIGIAAFLEASGRPREALEQVDGVFRPWDNQLPARSFSRIALLYFKAHSMRPCIKSARQQKSTGKPPK
jgi:hypothetical protein